MASPTIHVEASYARLILTEPLHWTLRGKMPDDLRVAAIRRNGTNMLINDAPPIPTSVFAASSFGIRIGLHPLGPGDRVEVDIVSHERRSWWRFWRRSATHRIEGALLVTAAEAHPSA